jgi:hypothetical protein
VKEDQAPDGTEPLLVCPGQPKFALGAAGHLGYIILIILADIKRMA